MAVALPAQAQQQPSADIEHTVALLRAQADTVEGVPAARGPFAVVDKRHAQLAVYDAQGRLAGVAPALLGSAHGERRFPDAVLKTTQGRLPTAERTTPAGHYATLPGVNSKGERVVWFDYANALAIHRLRAAAATERRPERLASPTPDDNRITLGCVVVDAAFFDNVVLPVLGRAPGIVVVLPEAVTPEP
jgi:hypothetical protein